MPQPPTAPSARLNVLVVDHDPTHLSAALFLELGCRVTLTDSNQVALAACAVEAFELILLKGEDDLVDRIRALPGASGAAFVVGFAARAAADPSGRYDLVVAAPLTSTAAKDLLHAAANRSEVWSYLAPMEILWDSDKSDQEP